MMVLRKRCLGELRGRVRLGLRHTRLRRDTAVPMQYQRQSSGPRSLDEDRLRTLDRLTPDDYRNDVTPAPFVRSGALPTQPFALKLGEKLVYGPEMDDKAMLNVERVVVPVSGALYHNGKHERSTFTCHSVEKPYLIFQVGSADPDLALQAARLVVDDVSGVELSCGCPKPFSTHSGMDSALLTNLDILCSILAVIRRENAACISVSAKIRLLPEQQDTHALVERIVNTGISCLTVHCRTRNVRPRERALVHRPKEIIEFVKGLGRDVALIENGVCVGIEDAPRIRPITGVNSVMIATAAEANPTFCVSQFKGRKSANKALRSAVIKAKSYADLDALVKDWTGSDEFAAIKAAIDARATAAPILHPATDDDTISSPPSASQLPPRSCEGIVGTPTGWRGNPDPAVVHDAPLLPANERRIPVPAGILKRDPGTPTPLALPRRLEHAPASNVSLPVM
ncbi:hypothetical protein EI94DRAFT_1774852 [Lactarius quietus]|nr:hypothetical protein EI94DRAFT_1774852 [Lactarius quietus]